MVNVPPSSGQFCQPVPFHFQSPDVPEAPHTLPAESSRRLSSEPSASCIVQVAPFSSANPPLPFNVTRILPSFPTPTDEGTFGVPPLAAITTCVHSPVAGFNLKSAPPVKFGSVFETQM